MVYEVSVPMGWEVVNVYLLINFILNKHQCKSTSSMFLRFKNL